MRRRSFLKLAAGAPLFNIAHLWAAPLARRVAQGGKVRLALIGCGAQMTGLVRRLGGDGAVEIAAMVDPDPRGIAAVKASAVKFYGKFDFSRTWTGADYREMFEKVGDRIDAVFIATPNHHHALPALMAARRGIHVYLEKPMTLTVAELETLAAAAKETGVVTQVGNYGHSTTAMRMCVDAVKKGVIGEVTDVWCYSDRVNSMKTRPQSAPPPKGVDWDIWCGGAPIFDYYPAVDGRTDFAKHDWHSWIGYGNGSIGNMGTHIMDAPFWALDLGKAGPDVVDVKDVAWGCPGAWAYRDSIDFHFPARGALPPVTLHWRDGVRDDVPIATSHMDGCYNIAKKREYLNFPPELAEFERRNHLEKAPLAFMGSVFMGTKGAIWHCFHSSLRFFPKTLGKEIFKNRAGYQADEHVMEFLNAVREGREANTNFDYSVPLARTLLLGNAASRAGKGVHRWDGRGFADAAANAFLAAPCRKGWEVA
jgi:predicted dehydrogenase